MFHLMSAIRGLSTASYPTYAHAVSAWNRGNKDAMGFVVIVQSVSDKVVCYNCQSEGINFRFKSGLEFLTMCKECTTAYTLAKHYENHDYVHIELCAYCETPHGFTEQEWKEHYITKEHYAVFDLMIQDADILEEVN